MKEISKSKKSKYVLLSILVFGFLLRVNNLTIGFPILYISNDEAIYHLSALNMVANKTPFTIGFYGPLGAYIQLPFLAIASLVLLIGGKIHSILDLKFLLLTQEGYMLFIPRVISAMFGTLSIIATYKICRELFKEKEIALIAGFLCAVSFNLVHISHLARGWSGAIFFCLLATLFALRSVLRDTSELRNLFLSVFFASIAFGFHQLSGVILILIGLIRIFGGASSTKKIFSREHLAALTLLGVLLFVLNYFSTGDKFFSLVSPTYSEVGLVRLPVNGKNLPDFLNFFTRDNNFLTIVRDLILTDGLVAVCALLFFASKKNRSGIFRAFFLFFLISILLSSLVLPPLLRYLLVAIILMPVFAAHTLYRLLEKTRWRRLFVLVIIVLSTFNSVYWNLLILQTPTFEQLRIWLDRNVPVEKPVAYTLRRNFGYIPTAKASAPIRKFKPGFYSWAAEMVGDNYPPNVRNVLSTEEFSGATKIEKLEKALAVYPVEYIVDSYLTLGDRMILQNKNLHLQLVAHFSPSGDKIYDADTPEPLFDAAFNFPLFKVDRVGPYFDVFKVE
jgi:hypothetical protein